MLKLKKSTKRFIIRYFIVMVLLYSFTILPDFNQDDFLGRTVGFVISTPLLLLVMFWGKKLIDPNVLIKITKNE